MALGTLIIIISESATSSIVKIRRESNEELAPDQLPMVTGIKVDLELLVQLRKVTFKEARLAQQKPNLI